MTEATTNHPTRTGDGTAPARTRPEERNLHDQVRGILREALDSPDLPEHARAALGALMAEHPGRPEDAFLEHLRLIRNTGRAGTAVSTTEGTRLPTPALSCVAAVLPEPVPAS